MVCQVYVDIYTRGAGLGNFLGNVFSVLSAAVLVPCAVAKCCFVLAIAPGD